MTPHPSSTIEAPSGMPQDAAKTPASSAGEPLYAMPATQGQIRFWSLDRLQPGNPALNMPLMWQCKGALDVERLCRAFSACVKRHEMLRTTFELVDGHLTQIIGPAQPVAMPVVDLSHLNDAAHSPEARKLIREHAALRMDLSRGPLLALKLLRYNERHHRLLVTMHHIICDGVSLGILLRDAAEFYRAFAEREQPNLPDLPIQFGDYAVWAEEWRNGPEARRSLEFWRNRLGQEFERLELHHDQIPEAAQPRETGDIETVLLPPELTAAAHRFCVRESATFNILMTSVFAALMSRLTGQLNLVIGSPCANRTEDTEELIGLFMNIQVMHLKLQQESTFRDLLAHVQEWALGAYENQALPFEDLIHDPFFADSHQAFELPVFFLYQKSFMVTQRVAGLEIVPLRSESPGAIFELMFAIVDRPDEGPRLQLEYNPQRFKLDSIQRILAMFVGLLESAIAAPEKRVDQLRLLSVAEREQILYRWNRTEADFGPFESIQSVFARRALLSPDGVAVTCDERSWSNAELYRYAAALAHRLIRDGVQREGLVGICVERSCEMLGSVLAVLLAGAAYVPLDPRYPSERLRTVVEDSGLSILIASGGQALDWAGGTRLVDLSLFSPDPAEPSGASLPVPCTANSLAYLIYTSGSTGRPKGVAIEHAGLMNLLRAMERELRLTGSDALVAITTLAFDIAGLELLLPLLTGARLVIATGEQALDGAQLARLVESSGATAMQATPVSWRMIIEAGWTGRQPLKVLCGGEAMPRDLAAMLVERSPEVWNVYGPTETTIWSSATRVNRGNAPLLLGPPIANTQIYILDRHLQPTPIGIPGEVWIGGAGVARGYWNRPELTAERFVENPFAPGRMYRTGDLARWMPDGHFALLGRSDFQIKVRGHRIEPEEVEAILNSHRLVRESVVVARLSAATPDSPGTARLVAYVAAGGSKDPTATSALIDELHPLLHSKLPSYLCPEAIAVLPELPRTPNGKIDRNALPDPPARFGDDGIDEAVSTEYMPPRDVIERQLVEIWQTTLGIPRIGIRSSFFSLGVGSLAALRLIKHMNRTYGLDLGLASLIPASTIESVAELVRTRFEPNTATSLVPIHPEGTLSPLFIVHGIGGNIVNFYGLSKRMGKEQPVFGIQAQALEQGQWALLRLEDLAAHYLREIRKVQPHGPYHLLGYSFGGTVALEMAQQLRAAGESIALLGMLDSKSRHYEQQLAQRKSVQTVVQYRLNRFRGNTHALSLRDRAVYVWGKLVTRAIRYAVHLAAACRLRRVPPFMKSAEDINVIAANNYKLRPFDGALTLFRATEQDEPDAPRWLGWDSVFTQPIDVRDLPGDHERIFLEPGIDVLADSLRDALHQAQGHPPPARREELPHPASPVDAPAHATAGSAA